MKPQQANANNRELARATYHEQDPKVAMPVMNCCKGHLRYLGIVLIALFAIFFARPQISSAQVLIQQSRGDIPYLARVLPVGLTRGQVHEVTLEGDRLDGIVAVVSAPGIKLTSVVSNEAKIAKVKVEVSPDAELGFHPIHVLSRSGISNPRMIRVDHLPQVVETEDNNLLDRANSMPLPGGASGYLSPADVDSFQFHAEAGQRVVFEIAAQRIGSPVQPRLALFDESGKELARTVVACPDIDPDVRLVHTFARSANYRLQVYDQTFSGADFATYHLRAGDLPFATSMFPLGGRFGEKARITLSGGNLLQPVTMDLDLTRPMDDSRRQLKMPFGYDVLFAPALFAIGSHPEIFETEPNDLPQQANPITLPLTINGVVGAPGDQDTFQFHGIAGQPVRIRVASHDLRSALDPVISILDSNGNALVSMDDRELIVKEAPVVRPLGQVINADDAFVEFNPSTDGDFRVVLEDRYGSGGPAHAYRMEVAPAAVDFELVCQPGLNPFALPQEQQAVQEGARVEADFGGAGTGALSIDRGGTGAIVVRAFRNGYAGAIELSCENLPPGVQVSPATIAPGQSEATLIVNADFEAPNVASFLRVVGRGKLTGSDTSSSNATNQSGASAAPSGDDIVRVAMQPTVLSALNFRGAVQREQSSLAIGVSGQGAELAVRGSFGGPVVQLEKTELKIAIRRREGNSGEVEVKLVNAPAGIAPEPMKIAAEQSESLFSFVSGMELTPGPHSFLLQGTMAIAGRDKPAISFFPVTFNVLPVAAVELQSPQIDLTPGQMVQVQFRVMRNSSGPVPIVLELSNLPAGVTASTLEIPQDASDFKVTLTADSTAMPSVIRKIVQVRGKVRVGENTIELPAMRFALKIAKPQ